MGEDPFSGFHPLTLFLYLAGAMGFGAVFQHPAYLAAGILGAGTAFLLLKGRAGGTQLGVIGALFLLITAINPLFNTQGEHVLFSLLGRPYTLEALAFGGAVAGIFAIMLLWFGCFSVVMTSDKFLCLFRPLAPGLALLLVMVLRLVPGLLRKAEQIQNARRAIGKGAEDLAGGMAVLSALASQALEGGVVTADAMNSRGYGTAKPTSFPRYRFTRRDGAALGLIFLLWGMVAAAAATGSVEAVYTPVFSAAPVSGHALGLLAYGAYVLLPAFLICKEALVWRVLRWKI